MKKFVLIGYMMIMASSCFAFPRGGDPFIDFTLPDTNWVSHSVSDFAGKVIWLNFWKPS
ncbi:MAG: hypothetical protein PHE49_10655 [bacterium]|nr:hypothetical protein [bacterium]